MVPLAPAPLPGPCRNAPGLVIAFVGAIGLVWLSETSQPHSALAAEWDSAWGGSPNRGRCQIPAVAPHNHSHTGPDIPPGRGEGKGAGGHGMGCDGDVRLRWVVHDNCKSLHLTESKTDTFWFHSGPFFLDGCPSEKRRFAATTKPNLLIFISHLLNKKFQQKLFQQRRNVGWVD